MEMSNRTRMYSTNHDNSKRWMSASNYEGLLFLQYFLSLYVLFVTCTYVCSVFIYGPRKSNKTGHNSYQACILYDNVLYRSFRYVQWYTYKPQVFNSNWHWPAFSQSLGKASESQSHRSRQCLMTGDVSSSARPCKRVPSEPHWPRTAWVTKFC